MNESMENTNNNFFQDDIEKISNKYNYIKNEKDLFFYLFQESSSYGWKIEEFEEDTLLISKNTICNSKENLVICLPLSKFNKSTNIDNDLSFSSPINVLDSKLICQDSEFEIKNLVNSCIFLNILDYSTEAGNILEKLKECYNIKILIFDEGTELSLNVLNKLNYDKIILAIDEDNINSLQISQEKLQPFKTYKKIDLENSVLENQFEIKTTVLFGTNNRCTFEKESLNPLKFNFEILDIFKNKFNIELLDINNLANLNERAYCSTMKIGIDKSKIQTLLDELKTYHTDINNNFKDLDLNITIELKKEIYNKDIKKISSKSFSDIKELSLFLTSTIFNENIDKTNSINLSKCNIDLNESIFTLNGIIQSNNCVSLNIIKNLILSKSRNLEYDLIYTNEIPLASVNKKDELRKKAIIAYKNTSHKKNHIKTVNSLNPINKFANDKTNNNGFLYSYEINKDYNQETISINNLNKIYEWLNDFLDFLLP